MKGSCSPRPPRTPAARRGLTAAEANERGRARRQSRGADWLLRMWGGVIPSPGRSGPWGSSAGTALPASAPASGSLRLGFFREPRSHPGVLGRSRGPLPFFPPPPDPGRASHLVPGNSCSWCPQTHASPGAEAGFNCSEATSGGACATRAGLCGGASRCTRLVDTAPLGGKPLLGWAPGAARGSTSAAVPQAVAAHAPSWKMEEAETGGVLESCG